MTTYIENPKNAVRKLLEVDNEFSKVIGYKFNMVHRNLLHLYTLTVKNQKKKLRKQSHLSLHQNE